MSIPLNAILEKKHSLHRAPPPKAPVNKPAVNKPAVSPRKDTLRNKPDNDADITQLIPSIKLKKTGFRASLIAEDLDNKHIGNNDEPESELQNAMARRRAMFEHKGEEEEVKPKPKPKPKPRLDKEDKENETKLRSSSCSDSTEEGKDTCVNSNEESFKDILTDSNKNILCRDSKGEPKLRILPTLESLGESPSKPPKPDSLMKMLEKYDSNNIVKAPRRSTLSRINENGIDPSIIEDDGEEYDDLDEDFKAQILSRDEAEQEQSATQEEIGILEENYDDLEDVKEEVDKINNTQAQNAEPICEESYDDLDTVAEQALQLQNDFAADEEEFGDDFYDAVGTNLEGEDANNGDDGFDSPIENKFSPSPAPSGSLKEKGKKDIKKEMENQKKKEREELKRRKEEEKRREREEKEEKRRKEEEKKKREREDKELRKKHKLKPGSEGSGVGEAKSNFPGDGKFELPVKEGDTVVIISEKGCPQGKWLVKNSDGHLGYMPTELVQLKIDSEGNRISTIITEDFYEDVDKYQSAGQIAEEEYDDQEVYDDIAGQEPINEDLYEELPADQ